MQATAQMKYVRVSPQKARLVVDLIRGLPVERALTTLKTTNKAIAPKVAKVLQSAVANAEDRFDADVDDLVVQAAYVNEGPRLKRIRPAPMGRAYRYFHKMSHIVVTVSDGRQDEGASDEAEE